MLLITYQQVISYQNHITNLFQALTIKMLIYAIDCVFFRVICGLTAFTTKNHIIRAALETSCYQVTDIIEAMKQDAGIHLRKLYVDGKMTENNLLLQLQSDISGVPICEQLIAM